MKKILITLALLMVANMAFAQLGKFRRGRKPPLTFQVAPSVFTYSDHTVYGFHIGLNVKESFNVSYFNMRDYRFGENVKDFGWYGVSTAYVFNFNSVFALGPVLRLANINGKWESPYLGAEMRLGLTKKTKLGFEYGVSNSEQGNRTGLGLKFIWNIY